MFELEHRVIKLLPVIFTKPAVSAGAVNLRRENLTRIQMFISRFARATRNITTNDQHRSLRRAIANWLDSEGENTSPKFILDTGRTIEHVTIDRSKRCHRKIVGSVMNPLYSCQFGTSSIASFKFNLDAQDFFLIYLIFFYINRKYVTFRKKCYISSESDVILKNHRFRSNNERFRVIFE